MCTETFLHLPEEKKHRFLEAAWAEFTTVSFASASINQIIKEAGIPRGSFYMYFQDKEDLFRYLLKGYVDQLFMLLEEFLLRNGGDIFQALFPAVSSRLSCGFAAKKCGCFGGPKQVVHFAEKYSPSIRKGTA